MLEGFVDGLPLTFSLKGNEKELRSPVLQSLLIAFHVEEVFLLLFIYFFSKQHHLCSFFLMS